MILSRLRYVALAFATTLSISIVEAPVASAEVGFLRCAEVVVPESGSFLDSNCSIQTGKASFADVWVGGNSLSSTEECDRISDLGQKGNFTDGGCTNSGEGEFIKVKKGTPVVTGSGGTVKLEGAKAAEAVACSGSKVQGELTGQKTLSATAAYTGCKLPSTGKECKTSGAKEGEIKANSLVGEVGIISKTEETMGVELWPASRTAAEKEKHTFEAVYSEFECTGTGKFKVRGALVGKLGSVNKKVTEEQISYTQIEGKQGLSKLEGVEGEAKAALSTSINGAAFMESGLAAEDTVKFGETLEVMSK